MDPTSSASRCLSSWAVLSSSDLPRQSGKCVISSVCSFLRTKHTEDSAPSISSICRSHKSKLSIIYEFIIFFFKIFCLSSEGHLGQNVDSPPPCAHGTAYCNSTSRIVVVSPPRDWTVTGRGTERKEDNSGEDGLSLLLCNL